MRAAVYTFEGFKSFAHANLDLQRTPVTLLIGRNGSGKSNAIEGVELLAQIAHGSPLHEIHDVGHGAEGFAVRGGLAGCARAGGHGFAMVFRLRLPAGDVEYRVAIDVHGIPLFGAERLTRGDRVIFESDGTGPDAPARVRARSAFHRAGRSVAADRSALSQFESFAPSTSPAPLLSEDQSLVGSLRELLRKAYVFDPHPHQMRSYERMGARVLARDGSNLSAVLHTMSLEQPDVLAAILARIAELPEAPYGGFEFVETQLHDVMFALREATGELTDARLISDGTLRCLSVLVALETAPEGSLVVIEELDNGLHPSRASRLLDAFWECASRRGLNVLGTTQNPATLDALKSDRLEGVVLAFLDKTQGASRLVRLLDLPRADVLTERGQLGDLVTRRIVEQYLAPDVEERAQQDMQAWLETLS